MSFLITVCCTICVLKRIFKARLRGYVTDGFRSAFEWHSKGRRFDPDCLHQIIKSTCFCRCFFCFSNLFIWEQVGSWICTHSFISDFKMFDQPSQCHLPEHLSCSNVHTLSTNYLRDPV